MRRRDRIESSACLVVVLVAMGCFRGGIASAAEAEARLGTIVIAGTAVDSAGNAVDVRECRILPEGIGPFGDNVKRVVVGNSFRVEVPHARSLTIWLSGGNRANATISAARTMPSDYTGKEDLGPWFARDVEFQDLMVVMPTDTVLRPIASQTVEGEFDRTVWISPVDTSLETDQAKDRTNRIGVTLVKMKPGEFVRKTEWPVFGDDIAVSLECSTGIEGGIVVFNWEPDHQTALARKSIEGATVSYPVSRVDDAQEKVAFDRRAQIPLLKATPSIGVQLVVKREAYMVLLDQFGKTQEPQEVRYRIQVFRLTDPRPATNENQDASPERNEGAKPANEVTQRESKGRHVSPDSKSEQPGPPPPSLGGGAARRR